jgi:hypothetical protein
MPGNAWRCHDGKGRRFLARAMRCLKHSLREKRHETIAATFWG